MNVGKILLILGIMAGLAGCGTSPTVARFARALATNDLTTATAKQLAATPVIDIHSHNFNARDIPIQNIALGRRDAYRPWTWLVTDGEAKLLAAVIVGDTEPEEEAQRARFHAVERQRRARESAQSMNLDIHSVNTITNHSQYSAVGKALHYNTNRVRPALGFKENIALRSIASFSSHHSASFFRKSKNDILDEISPFLGDLTLADVNLIPQYWKENSSDIHFRIVHMMDMGPTYGQAPAEGEMRPFTDQINEMARLQRDPKARMAYFVAYNPFRDNLNPGEALAMVQSALETNHAYGVKIYPPAGYRVSINHIPHRPVTFSGQAGLQWDYRYKKNGKKIPNSELDERLLTVLCWCASNDIPVFTHSGYGEFQARTGYGPDMPNPRWWQHLLEVNRVSHPELQKLRLCFGHAGGGDSFFHDGDYKKWSETVVEMCRHYSNVYCEVGCLEAILDPQKQAAFAEAMDKWCHLATDAVHPYSLGSKIMYGSDWFMPISTGVDRRQFLKQYQDVFLLPELQGFYDKFFRENALDYLNAKARMGDAQFPIDLVTKTELGRLLNF